MVPTKNHDEIERKVLKWFKEGEGLLPAVRYAQDIIRIMEELSKEKRSIAKCIRERSGLTKVAVLRKIKVLLDHDFIAQREGEKYLDQGKGRMVYDGRVKLLEFTERGRDIAEYLKLYELPKAPSVKKKGPTSRQPYEAARLFHSARLRDLLEEMAGQIPVVSAVEICCPSKCRPMRTYDGGPLPIENEILFTDLRNHLIDFQKFDRTYSSFKDHSRKFRQLKARILTEIELHITKSFGLQSSSRWDEPNSFSPNMSEWVFEAGVYLSEMNLKRHFEEYFLDFQSRVEKGRLEGREKIEYWVGGGGFLQVMRRHDEAEVFKREIDKKLRSFLERLRNASYQGEVRKAHHLLARTASLREELLRVIRKNLEVPIFGGKCEFLDAASETK